MGDEGVGRLLSALCGVVLVAACGTGPSDDQDLATQEFQKNEITKLPEGGKVAVGSPDGHRVVVQWQSPDGSGWSAPRTVFTDRDQFTHDISVSAAGGTIAIDSDFWTEKRLDDDYAPDHTTQILCRDRDCEKGHSAPDGQLSSSSLDSKGKFASFGLGGGQQLLWTKGTFRRASTSGLPRGAAPSMFPDGSFGAIVGEKHGDLCRYRLYTSKRHEMSFTARAVSGDQPAAAPCQLQSSDFRTRRASASVEDLDDSIEFRLTGSKWAVDAATSPLQGYADTDGKSSIKNDVATLRNDSAVSIGSPDTKRIFTQFRAPGSKEWTPPMQVATAPAGTSCRFVASEREDLALVAMVSCYRDGKPYEIGGMATPDQGIAMATSDGRTWEVRTLEHPRMEVGYDGAGNGSVFQGSEESFVWRPKGTMRRIALPSDPQRDAVVVTPDKKVMRVSGNPSGGKTCSPGYQLTDLDATTWPKARPMPKLSRTDSSSNGCVATATLIDGVYQVEFWDAWMGTLEPKDEDWVARKASESY